MTNRIGAHVSGGKDLSKSLAAAKALDCEAIQVFLNGPTSFQFSEVPVELDAAVKAAAAEQDVRLFVHGPYLMNMGSNKKSTRWSAAKLLTRNLERAGTAGAEGVVLHAGSSNGDPLTEGLARVRDSLLPVLEALDEASPMVLLEPMAGQGNSLCSTVESIAGFFAAVDSHPKLGLCLDTAHLLAAGEPLNEAGGMTSVLDRVGELVGYDRIKLIHANDSKVDRGAKRDRHENLGYGFAHPDLWAEIFAHPQVDVPLILETPGTHFRNDLKVLRAARSA